MSFILKFKQFNFHLCNRTKATFIYNHWMNDNIWEGAVAKVPHIIKTQTYVKLCMASYQAILYLFKKLK